MLEVENIDEAAWTWKTMCCTRASHPQSVRTIWKKSISVLASSVSAKPHWMSNTSKIYVLSYFHTADLTLNNKYWKMRPYTIVVCTGDQIDNHMHTGQQALRKIFCLYLIADGWGVAGTKGGERKDGDATKVVDWILHWNIAVFAPELQRRPWVMCFNYPSVYIWVWQLWYVCLQGDQNLFWLTRSRGHAGSGQMECWSLTTTSMQLHIVLVWLNIHRLTDTLKHLNYGVGTRAMCAVIPCFPGRYAKLQQLSPDSKGLILGLRFKY